MNATCLTKLSVRPMLVWLLALIGHVWLIWFFSVAMIGGSHEIGHDSRVLNVVLQSEVPISHPIPLQNEISNFSFVPKEAAHHEGKAAEGTQKIFDSARGDLPEPYYFNSRELTQKPLVAVDIPVGFALLVSEAQSQIAILRLLINEYGDIDRILVEDSSLPEQTKTVLLNTFNEMKFHPGEVDGKAVKSQLTLAIQLGEMVGETTREAGVQ